jgi:hypothetical protein
MTRADMAASKASSDSTMEVANSLLVVALAHWSGQETRVDLEHRPGRRRVEGPDPESRRPELAQMGHAPDGARPHGAGATDLEGALGADAAHRDRLFGPAELVHSRSRRSGTARAAPKRRRTLGQPPLTALFGGSPQVVDGGAPIGLQEPGGEREREVQADHQAVGRVEAERHEIVGHLLAAAPVAQGDELAADDVRQPDPGGRAGGRPGPVDRHDVH